MNEFYDNDEISFYAFIYSFNYTLAYTLNQNGPPGKAARCSIFIVTFNPFREKFNNMGSELNSDNQLIHSRV